MTTRFSCTGCGKCCTDHHVPLTLPEARRWALGGGQVIVLVEAFLRDGEGPSSLRLPADQQEHARRRSLPVLCGQAPAFVSITFAAFNQGRCRNLMADNRCAIYEERPLVCRIYPMEINPHIPLRPEAKECPTEAWDTGLPLIHGGRLVDTELASLIEASRQADRDQIAAKGLICSALGIRTAALKGDGFTTYLPRMDAFLFAMDQVERKGSVLNEEAARDWSLHIPDPELAQRLAQTGAMLEALLSNDCVFISLRRAAA
ncbi:YkgJ family cysteine cluster protein [Pseudomonas sp. dw_358]|uniref:YkgJ family cysteine cluster protein n=1 Tax=Pseudomonas sp. dw_358 TaxID=2720083 RepID=UPI001BD5939C|nr:YkgJ family cysteine cluster protein [Pseudomonas sp. dw_358]